MIQTQTWTQRHRYVRAQRRQTQCNFGKIWDFGSGVAPRKDDDKAEMLTGYREEENTPSGKNSMSNSWREESCAQGTDNRLLNTKLEAWIATDEAAR